MRKTIVSLVAVTLGISAAGSPANARKAMSEETQRRALLGRLAAASTEAAPQERTDADLMYEAMRQWHGEPRGSAAVDRALAQSKKDIGLDRRQIEDKVRKMFWKDPFSNEVVPVAKSDRDLLRAHAARESRVHDDARDDEVSRLRAEVTAARAENARLRSELSRADEGTGSSETVVAQTECALPSRRLHAGSSSGGHSRRDGGQLEALNVPAQHRRSGSSKTRSQQEASTAEPAEPVAAAAPAEAVTGPPAGWQSSDPRGIIVVPITASIRAH